MPISHARWLVGELRSRGVPHRYREVPDAPHSFHLQPPQRDLRPDMLAFLAYP